MFSRFRRLNARGGVEIRLGRRSTVFVGQLYAEDDAARYVLVGLRSKTSLVKAVVEITGGTVSDFLEEAPPPAGLA